MAKIKVNKLLSKKTKDSDEYWSNWLSMNEVDRELYVSRLIPPLRIAMNTKNVLATASLLNSFFQDLELAIKKNEHKFPEVESIFEGNGLRPLKNNTTLTGKDWGKTK